MLSKIDRNIWLINAAIFLLGTGYGIAISAISLFLTDRGFTKSDVGSLAAWFALGIVAFSLPMNAIIRRISAKWALVGSLAGYAVTVSVFPFLTDYVHLVIVRFFDGAFSVGVWVSCETILLHRAPKQHKALVTSLYAVCMALGYVIGPIASKLIIAAYDKPVAFVVSGVLSLTASIMVLSRLDPDRSVHDDEEEAAWVASGESGPRVSQPTSSWKSLLWRIKTSCLATFSYGYFQASVVLFLPIYLVQEKHMTEGQAILIPAFFATGMVLFSNVAGRLGDRYGHLRTMKFLGIVGTMTVLSFIFLDAYAAMCVAVFVAGASLASISPVSLALQGVVTESKDYSKANAIYNAFYAMGMFLGPPISSQLADRLSNNAMMYHLVTLWALFVVFTILFAGDDPAHRRRPGHPATLPT